MHKEMIWMCAYQRSYGNMDDVQEINRTNPVQTGLWDRGCNTHGVYCVEFENCSIN